MEQCNKVGLPFGLYWYSYALSNSDAVKEARFAMKMSAQYKPSFPIFYDLEDGGFDYARKLGVYIDQRKYSDFSESFCSTLEKHKFYPGIYANQSTVNSMLSKNMKNKYDLWIASWSRPPTMPCEMAQYTNSGMVKGVAGFVDCNVCFKNYADIIETAGLNGR